MKAFEVLEMVSSAGGSVELSPSGNLRVTAPAALPPAVIENLRRHKGELVNLLSGQHSDACRQEFGGSPFKARTADQTGLRNSDFSVAAEDTHHFFERWHQQFGDRSPYVLDGDTERWAREILHLSGARIVGQEDRDVISVWPERKNIELQVAFRLLQLNRFALEDREC